MEGKFVGDVGPQQAWQGLSETPNAVLLDVRTRSEWTFVGGPDLATLQRSVVQIEWQSFPGMARNAAFTDAFLAHGIGKEQPIYIICRSGVRSRAAAEALAGLGYTTYNVADGFEGQIDGVGHRGVGGWRALALPWKQT